MTADLNIDSDAKASGTLAIGLQKQAASMLGMTDLDSFSSGITSEGSDAAGSVLSTGDCTPSETDAEYVYTCAFSGQAFTDPADGRRRALALARAPQPAFADGLAGALSGGVTGSFVIARIASGAVPCSIRRATRWVRTRVLPLPAPASTSNGPSPWRTASRWGGLRPASGSDTMLILPEVPDGPPGVL